MLSPNKTCLEDKPKSLLSCLYLKPDLRSQLNPFFFTNSNTSLNLFGCLGTKINKQSEFLSQINL